MSIFPRARHSLSIWAQLLQQRQESIAMSCWCTRTGRLPLARGQKKENSGEMKSRVQAQRSGPIKMAENSLVCSLLSPVKVRLGGNITYVLIWSQAPTSSLPRIPNSRTASEAEAGRRRKVYGYAL